MEYYFEVRFNTSPARVMLVKAKDVIEAGNKASKALSDRGLLYCGEEYIDSITRTEIWKVIE